MKEFHKADLCVKDTYWLFRIIFTKIEGFFSGYCIILTKALILWFLKLYIHIRLHVIRVLSLLNLPLLNFTFFCCVCTFEQ